MKGLATLGIGLALLWAMAAHAADTVYYIHTDALGSPVAMTDANRNVIERTQYAPYGQVLNRPENDGPGYTGHEEDSATGLTNMQQRYDDKVIGRFLSVDPVQPDGNTGGSFNRYAYASDNPYKFTDPDGRASAQKDCGTNGCSANAQKARRKAMKERLQSGSLTTKILGSAAFIRGFSASGSAAIERTVATAAEIAGPTAVGAIGVGVLLAAVPSNTASDDTVQDKLQYDTYIHYGYAADKDKFAGGLRAGNWATKGPLMTGPQAQQLLALPHEAPPDSFYRLTVQSTVPVIGPTPVARTLVPPRTGGGVEYQFPMGTPPGSVSGPYPLPGGGLP